jgi:hypothetical protein
MDCGAYGGGSGVCSDLYDYVAAGMRGFAFAAGPRRPPFATALAVVAVGVGVLRLLAVEVVDGLAGGLAYLTDDVFGLAYEAVGGALVG